MGRLVADAENAALALGHDLELHRRLVEPGMPPLELTQRCPLRLADRLAGRLGRQVRDLVHLRLVRFFLRRTWRGRCEPDGAGVGCGGSRLAPSPLEPSSFGGGRELRLSMTGAGVFPTRRRVISPCPTVQRFVVTQYRTRPAGKRAITKTKTSGMIMKSVRWVLSAVGAMNSVEAIWLAT